MRLVILLIALAIGALLIAQQLQRPNVSARQREGLPDGAALHVPTTPQELPALKKSINKLVKQGNTREKALIRKDSQ